jgi:uncharacterized protein (DUF58 family)
MQDLDTRVYCTMQSLLRLRAAGSTPGTQPRRPLFNLFSGQHASRLRGRGLDFEELGHYRPGDDIRTMDWKVTRRTGKPHVRVFTEEKERPVLFLLDQRQAMFFGSVHATKSVQAAEACAKLAWELSAEGDAVGAVIFSDEALSEYKPQRGNGRLMQLFHKICEANQSLHSENRAGVHANKSFAKALAVADRLCTHNHLIIVISDLDGLLAQQAMLKALALHNDVCLLQIRDPMEQTLPSSQHMLAGDGNEQLSVDCRQSALRRGFAAAEKQEQDHLLQFTRQYRLPFLQLNTATPLLAQLNARRNAWQ